MAYYKQLAATNQVKVGAGKIKGLFVSSVSGSPSITIYDEAQGGTTRKIINTFTPTVGMLPLAGDEGGIFFTNGLYVVVAATVEFTIFYE